MTHSQLIEALAAKTQITQAEAKRIVGQMTDLITEAVAAGDGVKISGLGQFSVAQRKARQGRNPQTGEIIQISARKGVKFKAASALNAAANA